MDVRTGPHDDTTSRRAATPVRVHHGGTDGGPTPRLDLSTNANPFGPSPAARAALRVDVGPYPDPDGRATVARLAAHHGRDPTTVVLGAGATELLDRLVRVHARPVHTERPTFGEYAGAAARHGLPVVAHDDLVDGLATARRPGLVFVAHPGNPDGRLRSAGWWAELAGVADSGRHTLVADLAYLPMTATPTADDVTATVAVHAPNKAHGCTGLRAGWATAPARLAGRLRAAAVTWCVSRPGHAFLAGAATRPADAWVAATVAAVHAARDRLATALGDRGRRVVAPAAPFLLLWVGATSAPAAAALRARHGIRVRRTDSMGLPGWWRLGGLRPDAVDTVLGALDDVLPSRGR